MDQIHFHWQSLSAKGGSDHGIAGKFYPMEAHLVHHHSDYDSVADAVASGKEGALLVIGVMFESSELAPEHPQLAQIFSQFDASTASFADGTDAASRPEVPVDICGFLPERVCDADGLEDFYHYNGGLTTPPCNIAGGKRLVKWVVMNSTEQMSASQLAFLQEKVMVGTGPTSDGTAEQVSVNGNARPVQCRGSREVWWSGASTASVQPCDTTSRCDVASNSKDPTLDAGDCDADTDDGTTFDADNGEFVGYLIDTMCYNTDKGVIAAPETHTADCLLEKPCKAGDPMTL
jgi:carbonic anhydrase